MFVSVEGPKCQHTPPPSQKKMQVVEWNMVVQFVAFTSAINVTEATFVFPSCNRDDLLELEKEKKKSPWLLLGRSHLYAKYRLGF